MNGIISLILGFANKRLCTVEEFTLACEEAMKCAKRDDDGYINAKEGVKILYTFITKFRTIRT